MNYSVTGEQLTSIADAIRTKTGGTAQLEFPNDFVSEIGSIEKFTEHTTDATLFPTSNISIPPKGAVNIGTIYTSNNMKAVKAVTRTGISPYVYFLYNLTTTTTPQRVNCYLYNPNSSSAQPVSANSISVTVTYYT